MPLVEGLARAGGGTARFVGERGGVTAVERVVTAQLAEALQPLVTDVTVDWNFQGNLLNAECAASGISVCDTTQAAVMAFP